MNDIPTRASAVIIGAGIVGNGMACHLARLGWRDIVLVDKGPMPNPGGSTGHASNFIFPIEYSKMMMELTRDSTEQYKALGVFTESGGIEVARTDERMEELRRRGSAARAWGIPAQHLSPVRGGQAGAVPGRVGHPRRPALPDRRRGRLAAGRDPHARGGPAGSGALQVLAGTEVLGIDTAPGGRAGRAVTAVRTSKGDIGTEVLRYRCGVWSPRIARMAGAHIPLTPIVHQMISVGPVPLFADTPGEIAYPIVRDVDTNMYERQHGGDMEVGSYAHRPIIVGPDDIPSIEAVGPLADRDAVHPGRLRPATAAGPGAHAGTARRRARRHPLRDQRADLDDPGRPPRARRDTPRSAGCGRWRRAGSRKAPASPARSPSR